MIGDVIKAKKKLKNLVGAEIVKKLSARVQKAEAQSYWTASNIVSTVKTVIGKDVFAKLLEKSDVLVEVMKLLSTKPHTTSNSNYLRYVYNDQFVACLAKVHGDKMLSDEEIKELNEIKDKLEKYIKREGKDFKNRKHKDVSEKMQSLREVNRLKVTMTALTINLIDYVETLKDGEQKGHGKSSEDKVGKDTKTGRMELLNKIPKKIDSERLKKGDLTGEEYEFLLRAAFTGQGIMEWRQMWGGIKIIKPPVKIWEKFRKENSLDCVIKNIKAFTFDEDFTHTIIIPRQFENDAEKLVKLCREDTATKNIDIVDENGKSYKKELEEREAANVERIQKGDLTDEEYERLLSGETHTLTALKDNCQTSYWTIICKIKPPIQILEKLDKELLPVIGLHGYAGPKKQLEIPRAFYENHKELVKEICEMRHGKLEVVDENGKSYKKEFEEIEAEKERKRKDPENIKRIKEGHLTDEEYRTLLFKNDDDFKYLAGIIKVLKPSSAILKEIKVNDLVSRIIQIVYSVADKLTCIIPSDMGDLGKEVVVGLKEKYGNNYKKSIEVQDERGNSYD